MTPEQYLSALDAHYRAGNATEHTYRGDLQRLLQDLLPGIQVTNEPKRQKCGAPDYILTKGDVPVGFIEAKDIGDKDLEGAKKTGNKEQFDRYRASLGNLLITDYLRFLWYRDGELTTEITLGKESGGRLQLDPAQKDVFVSTIRNFATQKPISLRSPRRLAELMAAKARLMADVIRQSVEADQEAGQGSSLIEQMNGFKEILIHDITPRAFADVYAQTIAYGLFAARLHDPTLPTFSRAEAAELIPKSNPFLRKLFGYIAGPDIDDRIKWIVDSLVEVFLASNVEDLLKGYGKATQMEDPIIHFYETFLSEYDPALRKARGVWYTPAPVVQFIVRAVDDILKTEFGLKEGLADTSKTKIKVKAVSKATTDMRSKIKEVEDVKEVHRVQLLDPATGTGTFLAEVVKQVHAKFKGMQGAWSNYVEKDLIPRLNGFELLMASYAMAHLQLDLLLKDTGFKATTDQRLRVFLTNSLEESHPDTGTLFANWLAAEANEANRIKRDTPVMCVIGNPPYSLSSANKGTWINGLVDDYRKNVREQNINSLSDDYVKFLRYAQFFIEKNGSGIVAMITNNSFIDGITQKQMRNSLLSTFDRIYIYDLHGSAKRKEKSPDGSKDENVFDIQQGVSINIFIKKSGIEKGIYHFDSYGTRNLKYERLNKSLFYEIQWNEIIPKNPNWFFVPKQDVGEEKYSEGFSPSELFVQSGNGIKFRKDNLLVKNMFTKESVIQMLEDVNGLSESVLYKKYDFESTPDWDLSAKRSLFLQGDIKNIAEIAYRQFDRRFTYYPLDTINQIIVRGDSRRALMRNYIIEDNIGLVIGRQGQVVGDMAWNLVFICDAPTDMNIFYRGGGINYPLYTYQEVGLQGQLLKTDSREVNFKPDIVSRIATSLNFHFIPDHELPHVVPNGFAGAFTPLDLLDYIYAVLHHPGYRETYKEFLKIDFPRVPYPKDADTFRRLVALGGQLRALHLLEAPVLDTAITDFPEDGNNLVEKIRFEVYDYAPVPPGEPYPDYKGAVYINDTQYFADVPQSVWNFYIGGYQPAQKWLKDRKGRALGWEDIRHYNRIVVALEETRKCMELIGEVALD
ncbi:MAG: DNA methyltransferase [Chitinophagaceae bacterium]|nr:MAG: DNA methyltransferase [Chitinophagaceae bacterium]